MRVDSCLFCSGKNFHLVFEYHQPPKGETAFPIKPDDYHRQIYQCADCHHFVSRHNLDLSCLYEGEYVQSTYGKEGIRKTFDRIVCLPPEKSDNLGRVKRINAFAVSWFKRPIRASPRLSLLDVGSGLCVFPSAMKEYGWSCTALDPDAQAIEHAKELVGIRGVRADFMTAVGLGSFELLTFNKVLEHVVNPIAMLARAEEYLKPNGLIYLELPDGEAASLAGASREEFFIEHHHIFSHKSVTLLAERSGFKLLALESIQEPSTKYTWWAFLARDEKKTA